MRIYNEYFHVIYYYTHHVLKSAIKMNGMQIKCLNTPIDVGRFIKKNCNLLKPHSRNNRLLYPLNKIIPVKRHAAMFFKIIDLLILNSSTAL